MSETLKPLTKPFTPAQDFALFMLFASMAFMGGVAVDVSPTDASRWLAKAWHAAACFALGAHMAGSFWMRTTYRALVECRDFERVAKLALAARDEAIAARPAGASEAR